MAKRVAHAAEAALRENGYATAIDVMLGIGWLQPSHLLAWRTRRLPCRHRQGVRGIRRQIGWPMLGNGR